MQSYMSKFEPQRVPHSSDFVVHRSKKFSVNNHKHIHTHIYIYIYIYIYACVCVCVCMCVCNYEVFFTPVNPEWRIIQSKQLNYLR